jgi:hypothetical protein
LTFWNYIDCNGHEHASGQSYWVTELGPSTVKDRIEANGWTISVTGIDGVRFEE